MGFTNSKQDGCIKVGRGNNARPILLEDVADAEPKEAFVDNPELYEAFVNTYAEKLSNAAVDTASFNSAAFGHIAEPYAIKNFNRDYGQNFYH